MTLVIQSRARAKRLLMRVTVAFALSVVLSAPKLAAAQHRGGGGPGGGFAGRGMRGERGPAFPRVEGPRDVGRANPAGMHAGLQVGPPGRWWDDKHFVKQLKLTSDQQKHMDAIFEQSRPVLVKRYESLEQEEQRMEALSHAKTLDETALFAQIDRVEQARADLGKAATHYLVQLRNELAPEQITKLDGQQ